MTRLFVALDVPAAVRTALATVAEPLRVRHRHLRWVAPTDWHVTLAFLGALDPAQRVRARLALHAVAGDASACRVAVDGRVGRFGDRVLWAGLDDDGGVGALAARVRAALGDADVPFDDRPFRAHVTLARGRRGRPVPSAATAAPAGALPVEWTARRLDLMASRARPGVDGRYRAAATWPLGG